MVNPIPKLPQAGVDSGSTISEDTLFDGSLVCRQHLDGYRFSIDALLLAHFCTVKGKEKSVDLGAGCGVIGLILLHRYPQLDLTAFELQDSLLQLILQNREVNGFAGRMDVVHGSVLDIRTHLQPESVDLVVCNPPYGVLATGRINPGTEQSIARHEISATLADFLKAAAFVVKNRGRVAIILPAARLAELLALMLEGKIQPKKMRVVYSYPGCEAKLVLVEGMKNGGAGLVVEEPFYIYREKDGAYSEDVELMFASNEEA